MGVHLGTGVYYLQPARSVRAVCRTSPRALTGEHVDGRVVRCGGCSRLLSEAAAVEVILAVWFIVVGIPFGVLGAIIGGQKNAAGSGFVLGLLFGPFGAVAAFAMDGRLRCPKCHGRLDGRPQVCQYCNVTIDWPVRKSVASDILNGIEKCWRLSCLPRFLAKRAIARGAVWLLVLPIVVAKKSVGLLDDSLRLLAGKDNDIVHWFLRVVAYVSTLAAIVWLVHCYITISDIVP